jgi:Mannosylglycerate hydrolase MGH1-like glycoside hydrolase domain
MTSTGAESTRLTEDAERLKNWTRWGPYLSERQWGTVREDYSEYGNCWEYFPHDHARSRAYRWGEDGLLGISDREGRLCFGIGLWNGRDPILKERLFGLTGPEGNHGEDVKELYYFLDSTPTHSYMKALYKYPHAVFPYGELVGENARRGPTDPEYELLDTGVFDEDRYFDVFAEYAKAGPDDILIRLTIANRGPAAAQVDVLPTLWYRNTWSWGRTGEGYWPKPRIERTAPGTALCEHASLGRFVFAAEGAPDLLFTDNETNTERLFGSPNESPWVKDAFHEYIVRGRREAVNPESVGTRVAAHYHLSIPAGEQVVLRLRLVAESAATATPFGRAFDETHAARILEADEFYDELMPVGGSSDERNVIRQAYAGLLWSKQFFHYIVKHWLEGDPAQPVPPRERWEGRNHDWPHLYNRDVLSMPDAWEYPWYAAWDLAFHMIPFARLDADFAKKQLILFLREWYMHPNGQIPAYEFAFGDVNPPVHAWACWRVYKMTGPRGNRDRAFLERVFHKLLLNFTWWVNRKDFDGNNLFAGGFLGLDNIGVFDRSQPLPTGGHLEQADGTAWMAFYCATMLSMALELAAGDAVYEDVASKFFEHFIAIADAMNTLGGSGLWDEIDGFYYDLLHVDDHHMPLRLRSLVGVIPLLACENLDDDTIRSLPNFSKRMNWFLENRPELSRQISYMKKDGTDDEHHRLLAIPSKERLERVLRYVLDENEFLSPHGLRSVSKYHEANPYAIEADGVRWTVMYEPGESTTRLFGGNSNWRGPVWFPINFLFIEALERYHHFYGDTLLVEFPTGSGNRVDLQTVAHSLSERLSSLFLPGPDGHRPCHGNEARYAVGADWHDLLLFNEYFHGDTGRGLGASHQTGWTALAVKFMENRIDHRAVTPSMDGRDRTATIAGDPGCGRVDGSSARTMPATVTTPGTSEG